ncbi:MAG: serine/threonine protein kinase, partial [Lachnospiraceae bacterium]
MKLCMGCMNQIEDHLMTCPYCGFNEITLRQESYYLDPGTIIGGKYIVGRVLSYGGHTVSYLGMDGEANRKVIVKEYLPSDFSTRSEGEKEVTIYSGDGQEQFERGLTNFLNEANRIEHLQDPEGIARIYDCIAENDTGYVISEYVEGHTLKEILDSGKKYRVGEAKVFISKILKGLAKVHRMDIIHCDISPETIMVTDSGDIKLLDFGATRYVTTANSKSLSIILKRGYAPEEQYRSRGVRGPWTDVYAVAAVMYRMITGIVPQESVERVLSDEVKEPSKMGIKIPENVENALMNALNVYREERTQSADAFLKELNSKNVKRIKTKKKKNKTGKFPLWAKGLVACLAAVVIVGGGVLYKLSSENVGEVAAKDVNMLDLTAGITLEEAQKRVDKELNDKYGWDIKLEESENTVFTLTKKNDGTICEQDVLPSVILTDKESVEGLEGTPLTFEKKKDSDKPIVKGTITCTVYSTKVLRCKELNDINAYKLAKKLDYDTDDSSEQFKKTEKKDSSKSYWDLAELKSKDGEVLLTGEELSDILSGKAEDKEIEYTKDMYITYYASDFFYFNQMPDFEGDNINIKGKNGKFDTYKWLTETKKKKIGKKSLMESNLVNKNFYTFSSQYDVGDVVKQYVKPGEKFDGSKPMDEEYLLDVIGKNFTYGGKTGESLASEIKDKLSKVHVKYASGSEPSRKVIDVNVYKGDNSIAYFKNSSDINIVITTEKPVVTQESQQDSSGSSGSAGKTNKKSGNDGHGISIDNGNGK